MIEAQAAVKPKKQPNWVLLLSIVIAAMLVLVPLAIGLHLARPYMDFGEAASHLDQDMIDAKAAGVPLTSAEVSPQPPVRDAENAAPLMVKASAELSSVGDPARFSGQVMDELARGNYDAAIADLGRAAAAMQSAEQAAAKPSVDFHRDWDLGPDLLMPEYGTVKDLSKLFDYRAEIDAHQGDHAAAIKDLTTSMRLSQLVGQDPTLIAMLVRVAGEASAAQSVERCLAQANTTQDLQAYVQFLTSAQKPYNCLNTFRGESYMQTTVARNLNLYGGLKVFTQSSDEPVKIDRSKIQRSGTPGDQRQRAFMARNLEFWTQVFSEARSKPTDPKFVFDIEEKVGAHVESQKGLSYGLEKLMSPVYSQVGLAVLNEQGRWASELALAKVLEYKSVHGDFPSTLAAAGASAMDPIDQKPLRYLKMSNGVRVYSVGRNRKDDGGKRSDEVKKLGTQDYDEVASFPPMPLHAFPQPKHFAPHK